VTTTTSGSSPKVTYFDAFNRKTKEQHTGFDGRKIISDIHYDDLGRVKQASDIVFHGGGNATHHSFD
jgi:hypothetical protein